jgi:hypothetical protein
MTASQLAVRFSRARQKAAAIGSAALVMLSLVATLSAPGVAAAASTCPAIGQDTDCGVIITITDADKNGRPTITFTGQPPYDGEDDTLVGVVNRSKLPIRAFGIKAGQPVFAFDGDGITGYGAAGNARDTTGYGGPDAYFTNINTAQTAGTVNFITPIAPHGGTGYFALEQALNNATPCAAVINHAVTKTIGSDRTAIRARFTPNNNLSLDQAAALCGFKTFDWQQTITNLPDPSPYMAKNTNGVIDSQHPNIPVPIGSAYTKGPNPLYDPIKGGWTYMAKGNDPYPYYYLVNAPRGLPFSLATQQIPESNPKTLIFSDIPADQCLPGGTGEGCGGKIAPAGSYIGFSTHLVGVLPDNTPQDLQIGFDWKSDFNGTSGGVSTLSNEQPVDPGSGTGGITVTGSQDTTDYQYQGISIDSVVPDVLTVPITIRPGSPRPAVINPESHGFIGVTIESTNTFDAGTVDPASVGFGPNDAKVAYSLQLPHIVGYLPPGKHDWWLFFRVQDIGIKGGDTQACLTGQTSSHQFVQGCGAIVTRAGGWWLVAGGAIRRANQSSQKDIPNLYGLARLNAL